MNGEGRKEGRKGRGERQKKEGNKYVVGEKWIVINFSIIFIFSKLIFKKFLNITLVTVWSLDLNGEAG